MSKILPYQLEPEYSSGEENNEEIVSESEEDEINSSAVSRTENRTDCSCCSCESCVVMEKDIECICCQEITFLSRIVEDLPCVTEHSRFHAVCLNRDVLWTALVSLHDRESAGLPGRQQVPNRSFRYAAYRQFTWWVHGHLGKKIRRVIPSCTVMKIRTAFPANNGVYTGYVEGDDDDSIHDSELEQAWREFLNI